MKNILAGNLTACLVTLVFCSLGSQAQSKTTSEADYNGTFMYAVSETNAAYPFIFIVETEEFTNGKTIRKVVEKRENEAPGRSREEVTTVEGGNQSEVFQVSLGFGDNYCRKGKGNWTQTQYECSGPLRVSLPRKPESVKYSVEDKRIDGKSVKVYRKYSVFSAGTTKGARKTFEEEVATIDPDGYFISVVDTEGTLGPKAIIRTQKQTWIVNAKIEPIVAPIK